MWTVVAVLLSLKNSRDSLATRRMWGGPDKGSSCAVPLAAWVVALAVALVVWSFSLFDDWMMNGTGESGLESDMMMLPPPIDDLRDCVLDVDVTDILIRRFCCWCFRWELAPPPITDADEDVDVTEDKAMASLTPGTSLTDRLLRKGWCLNCWTSPWCCCCWWIDMWRSPDLPAVALEASFNAFWLDLEWASFGVETSLFCSLNLTSCGCWCGCLVHNSCWPWEADETVLTADSENSSAGLRKMASTPLVPVGLDTDLFSPSRVAIITAQSVFDFKLIGNRQVSSRSVQHSSSVIVSLYRTGINNRSIVMATVSPGVVSFVPFSIRCRVPFFYFFY